MLMLGWYHTHTHTEYGKEDDADKIKQNKIQKKYARQPASPVYGKGACQKPMELTFSIYNMCFFISETRLENVGFS